MSKFSEKIKLSSEFDPSEIISGIKKIQQELSKVSTLKTKTMLSGVSVDIERTERSIREIEDSIEKGFGSSKEVQQFDRLMSQVQDDAVKIYQALKNIADVSMAEGAKELSKNLDDINKKMQNLTKAFQSEALKSIKNMALPTSTKKILAEAVKAEKDQAEYYEKARIDLQKQIKDEREFLRIKKEQAELAAKTNKVQNVAAKIKLFDNGISADDFVLSKSYGAASGATRGREVRALTEKGGIRPTVKNENFESILTQDYIKVLSEIAIKGGNADDIIQELNKHIAEFGTLVSDEKKEQIFSKAVQDLNNLKEVANAAKISSSVENQLKKQGEQVKAWVGTAEAKDIDKLEASNEKYTQSMKKQRQEVEKATKVQEQNNNAVEAAAASIEAEESHIKIISEYYDDFREKLGNLTKTQETIDKGFTTIIDRIKYLFSISTVFNSVRKAIVQTYNDVKDLDKSFAQIAMVTNYQISDLWESYSQYAQIANKLGQSTNDVVQASVLYYQQGPSLFINEVEIFIIPG